VNDSAPDELLISERTGNFLYSYIIHVSI